MTWQFRSHFVLGLLLLALQCGFAQPDVWPFPLPSPPSASAQRVDVPQVPQNKDGGLLDPADCADIREGRSVSEGARTKKPPPSEGIPERPRIRRVTSDLARIINLATALLQLDHPLVRALDLIFPLPNVEMSSCASARRET
jgi:hypothetical protein